MAVMMVKWQWIYPVISLRNESKAVGMYINATRNVKYEEKTKKTTQNQSCQGKNQKRYDCPKPSWDPDIDWALQTWLCVLTNMCWDLKMWSNCCILADVKLAGDDYYSAVHGIKHLSIIIDHMAEFKKPVQCHMKARWRERPREELKVWIPVVNSTYQVISVLLHCFTAGKSHKTGGGWNRDNTEIIAPQIQQKCTEIKCFTTVTTKLTGTVTKRWSTITEVLMQQGGLCKQGTFTKSKPIKISLCRHFELPSIKAQKRKEHVDMKQITF